MFLEEDNSFSDFIPKAIVDSCNAGNDFKFMENLVLKRWIWLLYSFQNGSSLLDLYEKNKDFENRSKYAKKN